MSLRLVVAGVLLVAAVACSKSNTLPPTTAGTPTPLESSAAPSSVPSSPTSAPGSTRCHTADLSGSIGGENGAAGSTYAALALKNNSSASCTVSGYPGVSLVDAGGNQRGEPATRDPVRPVTIVTLSGGDSAYAQVRFPNPDNFQPGKCTAESANMRVYPPGETQSLLVASKHAYCPGFSVSALSNQPN